MSTVLAYGLNHKTAPLPLREKFAITPEMHPIWLRDLHQEPAIEEVAILSTCNRTEIYCAADDSYSLLPWLAQKHQIHVDSFHPHFYLHSQQAALQHLMRVASGLDSMLLGEPQILGQVKDAYHTARAAGTLGRQLNHMFQHVFTATKRIRTETAVGANSVSVAALAVQLAKQIFADLHELTILLIGAGDTIELAAKHLQQQGGRQFFIANRSLGKSKALADSLNGTAIELTQIADVLPQADIVISATASPVPIIGKGLVERCNKQRKCKPLYLVDLAMPRDIEPEVAELTNIFLYNLEDLQQLVSAGLQQRQLAAEQAEDLIELEVQHFLKAQQARQAVDVICAYRDKMQGLAEQELQRALQSLQYGKTPDVAMRELTQRLLQKTLHHPSINLRKAGLEQDEALLQLARRLFNQA